MKYFFYLLTIFLFFNNSYAARNYNKGKYKYNPPVAENGSFRGEMSRKTYRAKTVYTTPHVRKNGSYVKGHYRSKK